MIKRYQPGPFQLNDFLKPIARDISIDYGTPFYEKRTQSKYEYCKVVDGLKTNNSILWDTDIDNDTDDMVFILIFFFEVAMVI